MTITIKTGEDRLITSKFKNQDGTPINLSDKVVTFRCTNGEKDENGATVYLFELTNNPGEHTDEPNGITSFLLSRASTNGKTLGTYKWELRLTDQTSSLTSIMRESGVLTLKQAV